MGKGVEGIKYERVKSVSNIHKGGPRQISGSRQLEVRKAGLHRPYEQVSAEFGGRQMKQSVVYRTQDGQHALANLMNGIVLNF